MTKDNARICIEEGCETRFNITDGERAFYQQRNLHLPKRCPDCRERRKIEKARQA